MSRPQERPAGPYKGLVPYSAADAAYFFGRDLDREVVGANLRGTRLTLLYGASGVGKSSLLQAGVLHQLRNVARSNLEEGGAPEIAVAYFQTWQGDPLAGLVRAVEEAVRNAWGGHEVAPVAAELPLVDALRAWTQRLGGTILVLLDQFEDYFLYHPDRDREPFDREFARAVNAPDLRIGFLLSLREEALARLDRFKGRIPSLFINYLRLEHLDRKAAREAIEGPLLEWNRQNDLTGDFAYRVEPELVDEVLEQLAVGRIGEGVGARETPAPIAAQTHRIETQYLQLVLSRVWDEESPRSRSLRKRTLEELGGARAIVQTHLDSALEGLSAGDREVAAAVLRFLVTPGGEKRGLTVDDLEGWTQLPPGRLEPVLRQLAAPGIRILRFVSEPSGRIHFEIFHDILAPAVLDWRRRFERERERVEVKKENRWKIAWAVALSIVATAAAWVSFSLLQQWRTRQDPVRQVPALSREIRNLKAERSDLQQKLEHIQAQAGSRGFILSQLSDIRQKVKQEALDYQRSRAADFDLRSYALAYARARLKMMGPTQPGATVSYEREALNFFQRFVTEQVPIGASDLRVFDSLLDAYDQQQPSGLSFLRGAAKSGANKL
jgi:hypothetical protein